MKTSMKSLVIGALACVATTFGAHAQERIISAGANITELFFAFEAQEQLVAVDATSRSYVKDSQIPQVGYHRQLSAEGLMALNPTRLIGSEEMGPDSTLALLKASGVDVMTMPAGNTVDALNQRIDIVAELTNKPELAATIKQQVAQDAAILDSNKPAHQPRVIFLMISEDRPANAAGSNTPADTIISLSGGINPFASEIESYKPLSYEAIIKTQPDYILVAERAWRSFGGLDQILTKLPLLQATPAGQNKRIIPVPSAALVGGFGLKSLEQAKKLNAQYR